MTLTEFLLARIEEDKEAALMKAANSQSLAGQLYPSRAIAAYEAKRRIVDDFAHLAAVEVGPLSAGPLRAHAEYVVRMLGAIYADHPDYDDSWRP